MIQPGEEEGEDQGEIEDEPQQESLNAADFTNATSLNEAVAIPDPKKRVSP
ncbi:MAG: hypothetical protein ACHQF4_00985 [Sphingobacteriales bacterium]